MTKTVFALLLLCLGIAACDPPATETNTNANTAAKSSSTTQASPAPASSPVTEATTAAKPPLKAGDKVKVTTNGSAVEATVVSVDEKLGKVTVKVQGESKEKTVAIADIIQ
jgi:sRNA-binding protein